jgi:proteasome lid subunit RPN8/RPN11
VTLEISLPHLTQIHQHARQTYPQECCGLIVGNAFQTHSVHPMENAWNAEVMAEMGMSHDKNDRYWIDPAAMLQVMKQARAQGLEVIGVYHSHPDHPAIPSECDRQMAWAHYFYVIVSVQSYHIADTQCWQLDPEQQFQPVRLHPPDP